MSVYHDPIGSLFVDTHPYVSKLMTGTFNNWMPQPQFWNVEKVLNFLGSLDSEKLELKMVTYKLTMLLALTGSFRGHGIYCLDILYLIKHSSGYTFHFSKITNNSKEK